MNVNRMKFMEIIVFVSFSYFTTYRVLDKVRKIFMSAHVKIKCEFIFKINVKSEFNICCGQYAV